MKCFFYFRDKSRSRNQQRSAPELKELQKSDLSGSSLAAKSSSSLNSPRSVPELYEEKAHNLRVFTFSELKQATHDFNKLLKIGEGGFGSVYKGSIKPLDGMGDSVVVAIKQLSQDGLQGHRQWLAEVQFLGIVEHPNLVKLIGYCAVNGARGIQRLLVYEYITNRSLDDHLFNKALPALAWKTRLSIVLGAARGLAYLHQGFEVQIIYRDFKCSNVLLDDNFHPKLSDFGLAREGPEVGHTHVSTAVMGTNGYAAPDYIETGHLTAKSDVCSLGVVLYEILTGRRSLEKHRPRSEQKLLDWVKQFSPDSRKFTSIIDSRLENQYPVNAARKVAKLADACLVKSAKDRPTMSDVVNRLQKIIEEMDDEEPQRMNPPGTFFSLSSYHQVLSRLMNCQLLFSCSNHLKSIRYFTIWLERFISSKILGLATYLTIHMFLAIHIASSNDIHCRSESKKHYNALVNDPLLQQHLGSQKDISRLNPPLSLNWKFDDISQLALSLTNHNSDRRC